MYSGYLQKSWICSLDSSDFYNGHNTTLQNKQGEHYFSLEWLDIVLEILLKLFYYTKNTPHAVYVAETAQPKPYS